MHAVCVGTIFQDSFWEPAKSTCAFGEDAWNVPMSLDPSRAGHVFFNRTLLGVHAVEGNVAALREPKGHLQDLTGIFSITHWYQDATDSVTLPRNHTKAAAITDRPFPMADCQASPLRFRCRAHRRMFSPPKKWKSRLRRCSGTCLFCKYEYALRSTSVQPRPRARAVG